MTNSNSNKEITSLLAEIASEVVGQFNMTMLLDKIINSTMKMLNAEVCSIFMEDKENKPGFIKCVAGSGYAKKNVNNAEYKIGEGFTGSIAKFGGEYNINGIEVLKELAINNKNLWSGKFDKIQWKEGENEFRNLIAIPLKIKDSTLGVIKAENKLPEKGDHFTDDDLTILKTTANVVALAIENLRLQEDTQKQIKVREERDAWKEVSFRAAHKMGNVIFGLEGNIKLLSIYANEPNEANLRKMWSKVLEAKESLNEGKTILNEFKGYVRPSELNLEVVNASTYLKILIIDNKDAIPHNIKLEERIDSGLPNINIDPIRIKHCIREIIENASYYLQNNGKIVVKAYLTTRNELSEAKISSFHKKYVSISISDNGPGIKEDIKNKIFYPFFGTRAKGSGLGLSIVKQYINKHKGEILEIGRENEGAHFLIIIPSIIN